MRHTRLAGLVLAAMPLALAAVADRAAAERYAAYHDRAEVEATLEAWANAHPDLARLETLGRSAAGQPLHVLRVAGAGPLPPEERPAVFVGANVAGFHNAGTEAALDLARTLLEGAEGDHAPLLGATTFYIAPVLNPDAHDGMFGAARTRRSGNGLRLDRDRDGFEAEDDVDDLDGDGRITRLRIPDPAGTWLPHPEDPRLMVEQDPARGWVGTHRLVSEGDDDDGDGTHNEDPAEGVVVDHNFPHAFPYPKPEAGPWASYAPETRGILDGLFARRAVALAVVYGPANSLLAPPEGLGPKVDLGTQKFKVPKFAAKMLGFEPDKEYTLDEVWDVAKDLPFVKQQGVTKEQLAQFLGAGPATRFEEDDLALLRRLAKPYKERLKKAGLDAERPGLQSVGGGMVPWLYYQYGVLALELDVWGVPKAAKTEKGGDDEQPLTLDRLDGMSSEEFLALDEAIVAAFLESIGAPPQFTAEAVMERVRGGQASPERLARMTRQMGGGESGEGEDDTKVERAREILAWLDEHDPEAVASWSRVTLKDGTGAEVGGVDPFAAIAPPMEALGPALQAHTGTVLDLAGRLARIEVASLKAAHLGGGVFRVEAVAVNRGRLATHTRMAVRTQARLPIRLELVADEEVELLTGTHARPGDRLEPGGEALEGEWLVRARPGTTVAVRVVSENAGRDERTITIEKGASR